MDEVRAHNIFYDASITVVGWHGYGEVGPITYFTKLALLWLVCMVMRECGTIAYITEPALLWLAATVMGDVGAHNIIHGSITVVSWHGYKRGGGPLRVISRRQHYCGWLALLWARTLPKTYFKEPE